ncbi:carbonic anhydrase 2-like [Drosophila innubila]|uniref:carbonic anhydrase 2-like n=1 Tax=Drosophila innubila TaxID=198719 RepID=UPI00148C8720|nr:carbonic anhydrase 2-like [Drosophila innubila]
MCLFNRRGFGLPIQFFLLSVISLACSQDDIQLSNEYLKNIRADEAEEQAAGEYNYDQQGADWTGTCRNGQNQSPIDLITDEAIEGSIPRIRFSNYEQPLQTPLLLVNNGHTANMVLPAGRNGQRASISGGMLPGTFDVQSMHFHWGSPNSKGSEHAINFERYDVEIHIVHKNTRYSDMTVGEASEYADGLAVLGIMLNAVNRPPTQQSGLDRVFNALPRIIRYQSNATITGQITMRQLTGNVVTAQFFTYNGSLTTPNCAEAVTWTVFDRPVDYSLRQISKFWNLRDSRRRQLINNYRELQDTRDRPVYYRPLRG